VEKIGYGTMPYSSYNILAGGGFQLTDSTFSDQERYVVHVTSLAYSTGASGYTNGFHYPEPWRRSSVA
jgi:hypothetical protein